GLPRRDREANYRGAEFAVAGRQDEATALAVLLEAGRFPTAVIANDDPRSFGKRREVRLHPGPGRKVGATVHERGLQGPVLGLIGEQAVPVVALIGPAPGFGWRVRLGPREEALEERPASEHAPGRRIRGQDRVGHAQSIE